MEKPVAPTGKVVSRASDTSSPFVHIHSLVIEVSGGPDEAKRKVIVHASVFGDAHVYVWVGDRASSHSITMATMTKYAATPIATTLFETGNEHELGLAQRLSKRWNRPVLVTVDTDCDLMRLEKLITDLSVTKV